MIENDPNKTNERPAVSHLHSIERPSIVKCPKPSSSTSEDRSENVTIERSSRPEIESPDKQLPEMIEAAENLLSENTSIIHVAQHDFDYNDPPSWPRITNDVRINIISHGSVQGKDMDFRNIETKDGRRFAAHWFQKSLPNCEIVERKWLIYSKRGNAIFCFCCCLFENRSYKKPSIANREEGFSDWKNLSRIVDHEKSPDHRKYYLEWKTLETGLKNSEGIDDKLQKDIILEKERWRHILRAILNAIMLCAKNNLALRGSSSQIGTERAGIFLNIIELLGKYDKTLGELIASHKKGSTTYLSPQIQNEFINLLGQKVRNEILSRIRKSKYYGLLFDCSPDISHNEQMAQIIRYVYIENGKVSNQESFLDFICTEEKTGEGLASEILEKLAKDHLDIDDIRNQGYDNGANMAGQYRGVQARIQEKTVFATFIPCASHSLNLAGVHSATANAEMKFFFETVESIFKFFSRSTARWTILMKALKVSLKGHTDTRWTSKAAAIRSLNAQIKDVYEILQAMIVDPINSDTASAAQSLLRNIDQNFLFFLDAWNQILNQIDRVTKALQSKSLSLEKAAQLIKGLRNSLQELRATEFEDNFKRASTLASILEVENTCKRSRRTKRLGTYGAEDDGPNIPEIQKRRIEINSAVDILLTEMNWRYKKMMEVTVDFKFLSGEYLQRMTKLELSKAASDLALKYGKDLNVTEFIEEVSDFRDAALSLYSDNFESATILDLLQLIHNYSLKESYPNIEIAFRIFLSMPATIATCERSFSKLKLIKNYLRSTIGQERLSNLAILSIEYEVARDIDFDDVIDQFATLKSRKIHL